MVNNKDSNKTLMSGLGIVVGTLMLVAVALAVWHGAPAQVQPQFKRGDTVRLSNIEAVGAVVKYVSPRCTRQTCTYEIYLTDPTKHRGNFIVAEERELRLVHARKTPCPDDVLICGQERE